MNHELATTQPTGRSSHRHRGWWRILGAISAGLLGTTLVGIAPASAAPAASVVIVSTGTGTEDHFTTGVRDPGDDLSTTDGIVRTLDATEVRLGYTGSSGGSQNLVLTATLSSPRAGWDLRGTAFDQGNGAPCPGGIVQPSRTILECHAGNVGSGSGLSFDPVFRISALAGEGTPVHVSVTVTDANGSASATSTDVVSSAAPRYDLEKVFPASATQTPSTFVNEGVYLLKIGDADPLGVSALSDPVTFTDEVDVNSRVTRCDDTTPVTVELPLGYNPDTQLRQVVGTCNGAPFSSTPNTGATNGQAINVSMTGIDWDRIYPPPTIGNGFSDGTSGWAVAMMQFFMETDKADVELGDGIPNNNVGQLKVGDAIGMTSYDSVNDVGVGPGTWSPFDFQGNPNLGSDDSPGEDDLSDNATTYLHSLFSFTSSGKYMDSIVTDGQHTTMYLMANNGGSVSWPDPIYTCDKFDNRRVHISRAPNSNEAIVNDTANQYGGFPSAAIEYGRAAGWGPGTGSSSQQWWNMSQSGCDDADVVGNTFYTSSQVDWTNSGNGSIDANDVNVIRYRPSAAYLNPQTHMGSYQLTVHFDVADNNDGDYIVDYSSYDPDGPGNGSTWDTGSCGGGTPGNCPDPPELNFNNALYRPGGVNSGVMLHVDMHPTITKSVVSPANATGTAPVGFTYQLALGNTQVPGNSTVRQDVIVRDVMPAQLSYEPGSSVIVHTPSGVTVTGPALSTQGPNQVLEWTVSGLRLDIASSDMPVIQYGTHPDLFTPSSGPAGYINRASVRGPGLLQGFNLPWAANNPITPEQYLYLPDGSFNGLELSRWRTFSEARVTVNAAGRVILDKTVSSPTSEPGDSFDYTLTYGNAGQPIESMDAYDILPWDGDPRGSATHGHLELQSVTPDPGSNVEVWISAEDPAVLDALDQTLPSGQGAAVDGGINPSWPNLPATGSATWPCQIAQAGQPGCPALTDVTAIRIVGRDPNPNATGGADSFLPAGSGPYDIQVGVRSDSGRGGDTFVNNWASAFPPLGTPVTATAPDHVLTEGAIGDLVFDDVDASGTFSTGDHPLPGVEVEVLDQGGTVIATDTTDANGRWLVEGLHPGTYRARIAASQFQSGAPLEHYVAAPSPASNPDVDENEDVDHDANAQSGGVESGTLTLAYGQEPTGDDVNNLAIVRDVDSNLTVDFGVRLPNMAIGDLVFDDRDASGTFGNDDQGVPGVDVEVVDASGTVVGTDTTDADGRWVVDGLLPGTYRARITASQFQSGAPLDHFVAAPSPASNPDVDENEDVDHDANALSGGVESGSLTLAYGQEPTGDDVAQLSSGRDVDSNMTVDLGVLVPAVPPTTTTTTATTSTTTMDLPPNPGRGGELPHTGWGFLWYLATGLGLVVGGVLVLRRRELAAQR